MTTALHILWQMSFQACILILVVLAARLLLKKYSGFYTRMLWMLVVIRLLCPVFIETNLSLMPNFTNMQDRVNRGGGNISSTPIKDGLLSASEFSRSFRPDQKPGISEPDYGFTAIPPTTVKGNLAHTENNGSLLPQINTPEINPIQTTAKSLSPAVLLKLIEIIYIPGVFFTALVFLIQFLLLKRRISSAVCEGGNIWLCENIDSPFVIGVIHPRILLPYHMEPEARAHVLSHEQTHIRHLDPLLHFAGTICVCLHWLNPLVWVAVHKMNQDTEIYCDESTLSIVEERQRRAYAKTLLSFAESQSGLHTGSAFGESNTERRVKNIMKKKKKNFTVLGLVILLAVFCTAAFMTIPKAEEKRELPDPTNNPSEKITPTPDSESYITGFQNKDTNYSISEEDVSTLQNTTLFMPDFESEDDLNAAFFKDYLFNSYTCNFDGKTVNRYSAHQGMTTAYAVVDADILDNDILSLFGKPLSGYLKSPQEISEEDGDIIYEDGSYYIRIPSKDNYIFDETEIKTEDNQTTKITFLKRSLYHAYPESQITLTLKPTGNEAGFILVGKKEAEYNFSNRKLTGIWAIVDYYPSTSPVGISPEEIDKLIGTQLKFGSDYLMVDDKKYPVTEYHKEVLTTSEFDNLFSSNIAKELTTTSFDYYYVKTDEKDLPIGSHVYRYDFESALVVFEGVIFRISEFTEDLEAETALDQIKDLAYFPPDENGFIKGKLIPSEMLPGSMIYYTDDTHYIVVRGDISLNTPQKVEELYNMMKANIIQAAKQGSHVIADERPSDGMSVTYEMYGYISHIYPRDYPQKKLADGMLNWRYDDGQIRAVASGLDRTQPKIYYQVAGEEWKIFPLDDFDNMTESELDTLTLTADTQKITVKATKDGKEIYREIKVNE